MNEIAKKEITDKLVFESYYKGLSDTKWQKIAERIAKKHGITVEEVFEEYDEQFKAVVRLLLKGK